MMLRGWIIQLVNKKNLSHRYIPKLSEHNVIGIFAWVTSEWFLSSLVVVYPQTQLP